MSERRNCDEWCDPQTGLHAPWCTPLAARTSTATADTGLRERVEALADHWQAVWDRPPSAWRMVISRDLPSILLLDAVKALRRVLDATAAPTTDTGVQD